MSLEISAREERCWCRRRGCCSPATCVIPAIYRTYEAFVITISTRLTQMKMKRLVVLRPAIVHEGDDDGARYSK